MSTFFLGLALMLAGGTVTLLLPRRAWLADRVFGLLVVVGCGVALGPAVAVLRGTIIPDVSWSTGVPGGPWVFGIDVLSAAFLVVVLGVGAVVAVYGIGYLGAERAHRPVAAGHLGLAVLLASLALVVTARAAIPLLVAWEVMSLCSYLLVVFESERPEARRAGLIYLIATHAGILALFLMFATWAGASSDLTFGSLAAGAVRLPYHGAVVLLLALVGFGVKAGLVPLHFWLPGAHAAAPSHVSAVMSGIVIKMGVYGLLRVGVLAGPTPAWWGWTLVATGVLSGVLGVVWALAQHDVKRLLAYHSVENIGIIMLGAGIGALGVTYGRHEVAMIGFAGAVLHTLNHALFKSLLFFGAGSVYRATGTREMDHLGGLARAMPVTWMAFLVGAAAIVGLPPLNGFVSEWLVYQALFRSGLTSEALRLAVLGAAGLALIGALALACFAKVAGIVFLGRARTESANGAQESGAWLTGPMLVIAAACFLIGLNPVGAVEPALRVGTLLGAAQASAADSARADVLGAARWLGLLGMGLVSLAGGGVLALSALRRRRPVGHAPTWACGYAQTSTRMQYTAASFAAPTLASYAPVAGVRIRETEASLHTRPSEPVLDGFLYPFWGWTRSLAERLRPIQQGRLHLYLLYIVAVVLLLLVYLVAA